VRTLTPAPKATVFTAVWRGVWKSADGKNRVQINIKERKSQGRDMMQESLSRNKAVGGGLELHLNSGVTLKITSPHGEEIDFEVYRELTKLQEYINPDYCIVCAYFQSTKGHFGICQDQMKKPYDGTKKGSGCALWRLRTIYLKYRITQSLPEIPTLRPIRLIVKHPKPRGVFKTQWRNYSNPDLKKPWFWNYHLPKVVYDYLLKPELLPDSLDLKVWNNRAKKSVLLTCIHCGETFELTPMSGVKYCSRKCFTSHRWANHKKRTRSITLTISKTNQYVPKNHQGMGWGVTSSKVNGLLLHWNNIDADTPIQRGRTPNTAES